MAADEIHPARGGKRAGSGRKRLPDDERKTSITLCVKRKDKVIYDKLRKATINMPRMQGMNFADWWIIDTMRALAKDDYGIE